MDKLSTSKADLKKKNMHDILDTETTDAANESFWPEKFKGFLRDEFKRVVITWLRLQNIFHKIHEKQADETYDIFTERLADKIIISAENGADEAFVRIHKSLSHGSPLPCLFEWSESVLAQDIFTDEVRSTLLETLMEEYGREHLYEHIFIDFYGGDYISFKDFTKTVSEYVLAGIINGTEYMFIKMMRSYIFHFPLPPARRNPRLIKMI